MVLTIFPQLETVGKTPLPILGIVAPFLGSIILHKFIQKYKANGSFIFLQFPKILLFSAILNLISNIFENSPFLIKLISWFSILLIFILPVMTSQNLAERTISWLVILFLPYSMLTLAYESVFVLLFSILLFTYVRLEFSHLSDDQFFQLEIKPSTNKKDSGELLIIIL